MRIMKCMLLNSFACDQYHYSPCLHRASCWDRYITCTSTFSSIFACCTPYRTCSYYNSFSHLYSSCSSLSCCFLLHSSCAGVLPSVVVDGVAHCDVVSIHLDIIVHEQLVVFLDRQVHRHLIDYIPSCALNGVLDSALLETIVPFLLGGRRHL